MSPKFQPTPRSHRDDAVLELEDQGDDLNTVRTALMRGLRALDNCERRRNRARGRLRQAQVLEDQLAFWTPAMGDRRRQAVSA
jgi:exonuclease VII small subunit